MCSRISFGSQSVLNFFGSLAVFFEAPKLDSGVEDHRDTQGFSTTAVPVFQLKYAIVGF